MPYEQFLQKTHPISYSKDGGVFVILVVFSFLFGETVIVKEKGNYFLDFVM